MASGSPFARVLRDSGGGFDAASFAGAREWRASWHTSGCESTRRAVPPSCTRATAEGRREGARTTGRRSSERALGRERVSSEMRRDDVGNRMPSGMRTDAVDLSSGQIHWHPLRGPSGMRPRRLLREIAGATAINCGRPFGDNRMSVARSQTGPKHPAFPSRSGEGTPKRFGPPGETSSESWAARNARQRRNESIQSPREHRAVAGRQRPTNATDSSVEESPEVESSAAQRGDTQASAAPTARGNASR